jgi:anti-anti-sigma factor
MTDIFISYANEDQDRVIPLIRALETHGWSTWWDRRILPGEQFELTIEEAIERAKCLIVIWSYKSVASIWVRAEAVEGWRRSILIPVIIDNVKPPLPFSQIQAAKLTGWQGQVKHPEFKKLVKAVSEIIDNTKCIENSEEKKYKQCLEETRNVMRKLAAPGKNRISLYQQGGITVFEIKDDFTASTEPFFHEAYQQACVNAPSKILLKFNKKTYINSGGVAVLVRFLAEQDQKKGIVGITGLSDDKRKVFHMMGISKFAKIYGTIDDALENM